MSNLPAGGDGGPVVTRPTPPRLKLVKLDAFALTHLGRQYGLTGAERNVLHTMTVQAPWRSQEWKGSITDLAEEAGHGWRTVRAAIERLHDLGLIHVIRPFRQNGEGWVALLCYCVLVDPERCEQNTWDIAPSGRIDQEFPQNGSTAAEPQSRSHKSPGESCPNPALIAPNGRIDQGKGRVAKAMKEEGGFAGNARDALEQPEEREIGRRAALEKSVEARIAEAFPGSRADDAEARRLEAWYGRPYTDDDLPADAPPPPGWKPQP